MNNNYIEKIKKNKMSLISIIGSIASILALFIVLIEKLTISLGNNTYIFWRLLFSLIFIFAASSIVVFIIQWVKYTYKIETLKPHIKILHISFKIIFGIIIFGIFIDGIFAAIYWQPWLSIIYYFIDYLLGNIRNLFS